MTRAGALRGLGVAAALVWIALALLHRGAWPWLGLAVVAGVFAVMLVPGAPGARVARVLLAPPHVAFVAVCAAGAALLSWWVLHRTLRDQPLSIDAGIYLFQARALAHGHFGMPEPLPAQAFGDRFLLEGPDRRLYGIFPPGWPLALVPFVWLGRPMLIGPFLAAGLVAAQAWLGGVLARASRADMPVGELAVRVSLLLSLASIGRALETADLLSHAFVAVLACVALGCALEIGRAPRLRGAIAGACVGWVLAARLLDGVVLGAAVAGVLVWSAAGRRALAWAALGATPLLALLALEQHAATGAWLTPTQSLYFARSDWPSSCHRLGFGVDVGCTVEHPGLVARFGPHGFGPAEGLAVTRERAGSVGEELFGFAPLVLLAFVPLVVGASAVDAVVLAFVLALTSAYGLFYYGNSMFFGARHLFPAAPMLWLLVARGAVNGASSRVHGAAVVAVLAAAVVVSRGPWTRRSAEAAAFQASRSDLRRAVAIHGVDRGIIKTRDYTSLASAFDPWVDGSTRLFALDDGSGLLDLRRAHPDLPVFLSLSDDDLGRMYPARPPPGLLVELERAWPSFVRPGGAATRQASQEKASGAMVLLVSHASPGATVGIPFDVAVPGPYVLHLDGFGGPESGDYELTLDGEPMPGWHGYAVSPVAVRTDARSRNLDAGRHLLVARCSGHEPASAGYDARLDALVGEVP